MNTEHSSKRSVPKCQMVRTPVGSWRQGTTRTAVIASRKFSLAERLPSKQVTELKPGEQSRIDEHFKNMQTLYHILLAVICVIISLLLSPNRNKQIEDALKTLNTLGMAEAQFDEQVIEVQAEVEKQFRAVVFSELAKAVQQTFGLTLDVSSGELNLEPGRSFAFTNMKKDDHSVGSLVNFTEKQALPAVYNTPDLKNILDGFPPELRSINEKIILLRLSLNYKRKGDTSCDYLVVFKPATSDQEIVMKGSTGLRPRYQEGKRTKQFVVWPAGTHGKHVPAQLLDTKPLRTLWIWPDIQRITVDEARTYLLNLKASEKSSISFLNITIPTNTVVIVGPVLTLAILLHLHFHARHINGVLSIYGDRLNIKFPWIATIPDLYFRLLSVIIFSIAPFVVCSLLLNRLGESVPYLELIISSIAVLSILCMSIILFLDLKKLRKKIW